MTKPISPLDIFPQAFSAAAKSKMCKTTKLALQPGPGITFPKPATCPVNGFGGSWYNQPFAGVPIYNRGAEGVVTEITWAAIDEWSTGAVANVWVTTGACLGLCLATLAYIVALTPNKKKGLPFHTSLLLALVFEIARLLCDMGRSSSIGLSPYSAYLGITNDMSATTYDPAFQGITIAGMVCATLAFFFTIVCFFIQASGLLTGLHMRYQPVYVGVISYLLTASFVAFALRISFTVVQSLWITEAAAFNASVLVKMRLATGVAYAISLGSWCTVSLASVSWLMFTRSKLIVSNRPYDTALTILSLVFMESFVVPSKSIHSSSTCLLMDSSRFPRPPSLPKRQVPSRRARGHPIRPRSPTNGLPFHDSSHKRDCRLLCPHRANTL